MGEGIQVFTFSDFTPRPLFLPLSGNIVSYEAPPHFNRAYGIQVYRKFFKSVEFHNLKIHVIVYLITLVISVLS